MNGIITAGHTIDKNGFGTGAYGIVENKKRFDEAKEARILSSLLLKELKSVHQLDFLTEDDSWNLSQVINFIKLKVTKPVLAIDIHFNAYTDPISNGTEVFVPNAATELEKVIAETICKTICTSLGTKMRAAERKGVKRAVESQHPRLAILEDPKAAINILLEICFITNEGDVKKYRENLPKLVTNLAIDIANFTKSKT